MPLATARCVLQYLYQVHVYQGMCYNGVVIWNVRFFNNFLKTFIQASSTVHYFICILFYVFSSEVKCDMKFGIFIPPQAENAKVPVVYWLSGMYIPPQEQEHQYSYFTQCNKLPMV